MLLLGVSGHVVSKNKVFNNDFVGIGVLGWCTAVGTGDPARNCINDPPQADPSANDNLISGTKLRDNGTNPPPLGGLEALAADLTYFQFEPASGNCFENNTPSDLTFVSSEGDGQLPTDGC